VTTLDDARVRWLKERDRYEAFGKIIAAKMNSGVRALGLWCETSSRAKELHSLIKKLLRKPHHTYDSLSDKVGARCIIRYRDDLARVTEAAQRLFVCGPVDSKIDSLGVAQIGYLSIHIDVSLRENDPFAEEYVGVRAELQIRTLAQHLWSDMSHDSVYKNDEVFSRLPDTLKRRVNLMAGVIEVADMEFNRLNGELKFGPEVQIYKELETHFYRLTAHAPDPALSLEIISLLLPLYEGAPIAAITSRVDAYVAAREEALQGLYAVQDENPTSELIFQPEALLIAELLDHDEQTALRTLWNTRFPEAELERLAVAFGHSFD
jgi:ppGpp synthetase/RelA/SpoT-type nucleotidyltranferase